MTPRLTVLLFAGALLVVPVLATAQTPIVNPPPPTPGDVRVARWLIGAAMVTAGTDYGVTMYGVGTGRVREANPVWRWASDRPALMGALKLGMAAGSSAILLRDHRRHPKRTAWLAAGLTAINVAVIVHNTRAIRRAGGPS